MRIVIIGGGMLATALLAEAERRGIAATSISHRSIDVTNLSSVSVTLNAALLPGDVVVNCAGVRPGGSAIDMVLTNSLGPWILASVIERVPRVRMIHVSTDCVFSGSSGQSPVRHGTDETPNPDSIYGRTKLAGEVDAPCVTNVRTSFVGPDHGLWAWIASQPKHAVIEGWNGAWWSGSTVWAVAEALIRLCHWPTDNVEHIAVGMPQTKFEVVTELVKHIGRDDIRVVPSDTYRIDRSLRPTYRLEPFSQALAGAPA